MLRVLFSQAFLIKCADYALMPSLQQFFSAGLSSHTCSVSVLTVALSSPGPCRKWPPLESVPG